MSPAGVDLCTEDADLATSGHGKSTHGGGLDGNILSSPLDLCLYRAPTDNDRGGKFLSAEHMSCNWTQLLCCAVFCCVVM